MEGEETRSELGYTGALRLSGGLLYLKARVYHAELKAFLQPDSVERLRYAYVQGDPVNHHDPTGLMTKEWGVDFSQNARAEWVTPDEVTREGSAENYVEVTPAPETTSPAETSRQGDLIGLQSGSELTAQFWKGRQMAQEKQLADDHQQLDRQLRENVTDALKTPLEQIGVPLENSRITSRYGTREIEPGQVEIHRGVDLAAPHGSPVRVGASGRVVETEQGLLSGTGKSPSKVNGQSTGGQVTIEFGNLRGVFIHVAPGVSRGASVRPGQEVARTNESGRQTKPHLHVSIQERVSGKWVSVDPLRVDPTRRTQ